MNSETTTQTESPASDGPLGSTGPRFPEVGEYVRNCGRLVEVQDVTPPVTKVTDYVFEDTSARVECRVNGKVLKKYSVFNNFYGEDYCVAAAIKEAKELQRQVGESDVEFVVVKITERTRMRPTGRQNFYAKEFHEFKWLDHGSKWNLPDEIEEDVWSSKAQCND